VSSSGTNDDVAPPLGQAREEFGTLPARAGQSIALTGLRDDGTTRDGLRLRSGQATITIDPRGNGAIRVRVSPDGTLPPTRSWAPIAPDEVDARDVAIRLGSQEAELAVPRLRAVVDLPSGAVSLRDAAGHAVAADVTGALTRRGKRLSVDKRLAPGERHFGFGQRTGGLDQTAGTKTFWTSNRWNYGPWDDELYVAIPFFLAVTPDVTYGLLLEGTHWARVHGDLREQRYRLETAGPVLDYTVFAGSSPVEVIEGFTALTGRAPLPARWALGFHQSRWGYDSAAMVAAVAREFRARELPCDAIHLDIDHMDGYRVFTWNRRRFPEPGQLARDLDEIGVRLVAIVDPGVKHDPEAEYATFDEGVARDAFLRTADGRLLHGYAWPDRSLWPDLLDPDVADWWADQHRALTAAGVRGIWNDMNEPSINARPFGDADELLDVPLDVTQGPATERVTHAEAHNLYGLTMAAAARRALEEQNPSERPFVLTRSASTGVQRHSTVWTGDTYSCWEHLAGSLPMLLGLGLSGVPHVGADVGGFGGDATPELFARWMQLGVLYPFMRSHSERSSGPVKSRVVV
jgi:alpha-glucosidase